MTETFIFLRLRKYGWKLKILLKCWHLHLVLHAIEEHIHICLHKLYFKIQMFPPWKRSHSGLERWLHITNYVFHVIQSFTNKKYTNLLFYFFCDLLGYNKIWCIFVFIPIYWVSYFFIQLLLFYLLFVLL